MADARTLPAYSDTLRKPLTQEEIGGLPSGSLDFQDGDAMINVAFPQVWPRTPS